ncbi:hypothetical protein NDU88_002551 [Pleurodeles waltl]|uniref:Secreted protein n=1 Tax=Pleurodeles waltl TaxID=8319 RepID=A0AAV7U9K8_PLEWA|nr:hypothetical protein NDU88_002551 [Pleurodeles waltl]
MCTQIALSVVRVRAVQHARAEVIVPRAVLSAAHARSAARAEHTVRPNDVFLRHSVPPNTSKKKKRKERPLRWPLSVVSRTIKPVRIHRRTEENHEVKCIRLIHFILVATSEAK